jgi:hypothetical protein
MSKDLPQLRTFQNKAAKIGIFLLFCPQKTLFLSVVKISLGSTRIYKVFR